jgi:ribonuclease HI
MVGENKHTRHPPLTLPKKSCWQLQYSLQDFKNWLNSQDSHVLCFDGASKGNPGEAGAGGVLYNPRGKRMLCYSWNLGVTTNNMAEAYAMYQGALLAQDRQLSHIIVIGDSKNIIRHFVTGTGPKNSKLKRIIERTRAILSTIHSSFYHVPCTNNMIADEQANLAIGKAPGHMEVLGRHLFLAPPPPPPNASALSHRRSTWRQYPRGASAECSVL